MYGTAVLRTGGFPGSGGILAGKRLLACNSFMIRLNHFLRDVVHMCLCHC